jgi:hypothetical protein
VKAFGKFASERLAQSTITPCGGVLGVGGRLAPGFSTSNTNVRLAPSALAVTLQHPCVGKAIPLA